MSTTSTRSKWHLENTGFGQWVKYWNLGRVYRRTPNAIMAILLFRRGTYCAYWLPNAGPHRGLPRRSATMPYVTVGNENSGNIDLFYEDHGSGKLIKGSRLQVVKDGPHCVTWTHADQVNCELLAFIGEARLPSRNSPKEDRDEQRM